MRIASYNVENLFSRVRVMNGIDPDLAKKVLDAHARLNAILAQPAYSDEDREITIPAALKDLGLGSSDESKFALLRQNRQKLLKRPSSGKIVVVAEGRDDWVGWVELQKEPVNQVAMQMTARVIRDVNADVLAVVEAEDRIALTRFSEQLLRPLGAAYDGVMLIDGNDERGIDVGLMTRPPFRIESMVSHVDDLDGGRRVFSRDCPEFTVRGASGQAVLVLVNHFKSKGFGSQATSNARRKAQAQRVREIYDQRRGEGVELIAIVGDLNDTPNSPPLEPLLGAGSDLRDITAHPAFVSDGRPGTYANGTASNKIDYVLLSPALFDKVTGGRIFRMGVWGGVNGTLFPHYDEMKKAAHAASDHAAIYADVDV